MKGARQRLIISGYGGFVAGSIVWQALRSDQWDLYALTLTAPAEEQERFHVLPFDLCDVNRTRQVIADIRPDAVIHTAALADIDYCQTHQEEAERVNVGVTRELAQLCGDIGAKLILCSTDSVFDGVQGLYTEVDAPHPVNFYAETKVRAEEAVREHVEGGVIARLSLVMGLPVLGAGNSFLAKMIASLAQGEQVKFPANEIRTPVDVITVGRALLEIAAGPFAGILHLAGSTRLDRYEMACQIAERLGHSRDRVLATDSNAMAGRAPRPNDASLDNAKARRILRTPMRTLMDGFDLVMQTKEEQERAA
ncbi:MAG: SDR family oxidoreductase [Candidatus Hydrogenedentes bacterium]|nr:SDR family oxidoreductase [Candidatus Hydrogenedentota bacterium]